MRAQVWWCVSSLCQVTGKNNGGDCWYCLRAFESQLKGKYKTMKVLKTAIGSDRNVKELFVIFGTFIFVWCVHVVLLLARGGFTCNVGSVSLVVFILRVSFVIRLIVFLSITPGGPDLVS